MIGMNRRFYFCQTVRKINTLCGLALGLWLVISGAAFAAPGEDAAPPTDGGAAAPTASSLPYVPDSNDIFFYKLQDDAKAMAAAPFVEADAARQKFLQKISREDWDSIIFQEALRLWRNLALDFQIAFYHPGFIFDQPPIISVFEGGVEQDLPFSAERVIPFSQDYFTYKNTELKEAVSRENLNFAGFRIMYPLHSAEKLDEVISFLGATHFRGLARHSRYGLEARALILNPAQPEGEEFPYFRKFWITEPKPNDSAITVFALLDSPSLTGAYRFDITPGPSTIMQVDCHLFKRAGREFPVVMGLAPLGSMYLYSEKEGQKNGNWRPEVHNSDTLLFATFGGGQSFGQLPEHSFYKWFSRPLSNPERLEINSYEVDDLRGFGLMQGDDNFDHYQDLDARYDLRPSLWIEPFGGWGPGRLELLEIPAGQDINSNILAFWRPAAVKGDELNYIYKMFWMPAGVIPHRLGRAGDTRISVLEGGDRHFIIDFTGPLLSDVPAESGVTSQVSVSDDIQIQEKKLRKNPVTGGWRLEFKIRPPESGVVDNLMSARGEKRSLHIEAVLKRGENFTDSLTETWMYDLPY